MRRATVLAVTLFAAGRGVAAAELEQGFLRVVEGHATLVRVEDGEASEALANTPVLPGDRVWLSPTARVEVILPDAHRLRLGEGADLELLALAQSLDQESPATVLELHDGALALDVPNDVADRTRVDTGAATLYLEPDGLYLIETDPRGYTSVVVRSGEAEMLTAADAVLVAAGEQAETSGERSSRIAIHDAPRLADVELWALELEDEARRAELDALDDPDLRYAAAPLERHGAWLHTDYGRAWRPHVEADWRPYWHGYWTYSPAGLVWASYEPWGWVPYHYGSWDLHPAYGWVWYPGYTYATAHVVWSWGSSHVAWIPSGYYRNHYARRFGFHVSFGSGFYGVSHADWRAYRHWNFCPTGSIGFRHQHRFHRDHRVLDFDGHRSHHQRAFITADTRGIERGRWTDAAAVEGAVLRRAHRRTGGETGLRDVSAIIARSDEVSPTVLRDIDRGSDAGRRTAAHRPAGGAGGGGLDAARRGPQDAGDPASRVSAGRGGGVDAGVGDAGGRAHRRGDPRDELGDGSGSRVLAGRGGGVDTSVESAGPRAHRRGAPRDGFVEESGSRVLAGRGGAIDPGVDAAAGGERRAAHRAGGPGGRGGAGGPRTAPQPYPAPRVESGSAGRSAVRAHRSGGGGGRAPIAVDGQGPTLRSAPGVGASRGTVRQSARRGYPGRPAISDGVTTPRNRSVSAPQAARQSSLRAPRPEGRLEGAPSAPRVRERATAGPMAPRYERIERRRESAAATAPRASRSPYAAARSGRAGEQPYAGPPPRARGTYRESRPTVEAVAPAAPPGSVARGYRQQGAAGGERVSRAPMQRAAPPPREAPQGPRASARYGGPAPRTQQPTTPRIEGARAPRSSAGAEGPRATSRGAHARSSDGGGGGGGEDRAGGTRGGGHRAARRN